MTDPDALEVHPLSPPRLDDLLAFFDGPAFADHPEWGDCYCQFHYVDPARVHWAARSGADNRQDACARTQAGTMRGWLAYRGGEIVGWCNAAPRALLGAFADAPDPDAASIGQITCFVVAKAHRRRGVASALLRAACDGLRAQGLSIAEAMPRPGADGDAAQYHGPLGMFLREGFVEHRRDDDDGVVVVRKRLSPGAGGD